MTAVEITGRILFLSADPLVMDAQLAGADLELVQAGALRDDISTDEITPVAACIHFDERLASYPYTGFKAGERRPIGVDAVRNGGFAVTVAGGRYGKGSSREHSPLAEKAAGIRLVIAKSFERIYRQNADNLGLLTSTDFGLIDRIRRGEPIDIEELIAARDEVAAAILRSGGLLRYGARRLRKAQRTARRGCRKVRRLSSRRSLRATPCRRRTATSCCGPGRAPSCAPIGASFMNISPECAAHCCMRRSAGRRGCMSASPLSRSRIISPIRIAVPCMHKRASRPA